MTENQRLRRFLEKRDQLIDLLVEEEIDKESFIDRNLEILDHQGMRPYLAIASLEEGLYNYHYYNILAKHHSRLAQACGADRRGRKRRQRELGRRDNYYIEKDKVIGAILHLVAREHIRAYPILMESRRLAGSLIEIVILSHDRVILHSRDPAILAQLRQAGVFEEEAQTSLIHDYVNQPY